MRRYENVDVAAVLGAVMEVNTEHYKSDFRYDLTMFRAGALNPDGENNHLLWLSRQSGTECFFEREAYLKPTQANYTWCYHVGTSENCRAYAVEIKGMENGRVVGDIYELDYKRHVMEMNKNTLSVANVTAKYADGAELRMSYKQYDDTAQRLVHEHGSLVSLRREPEDEGELTERLQKARGYRKEETRPAVFKVAIHAGDKRPSIRQQLADGKEQVSKQRAAAPKRAAAKPNQMEV